MCSGNICVWYATRSPSRTKSSQRRQLARPNVACYLAQHRLTTPHKQTALGEAAAPRSTSRREFPARQILLEKFPAFSNFPPIFKSPEVAHRGFSSAKKREPVVSFSYRFAMKRRPETVRQRHNRSVSSSSDKSKFASRRSSSSSRRNLAKT